MYMSSDHPQPPLRGKHGNMYMYIFTWSYPCACHDIMVKWNGIQRPTLCVILNQMEGMCVLLLHEIAVLSPSHPS